MPHSLTYTRVVPRPAVLHAAVARTDGPSSEIVWEGDRLTYRSWRGDDPSPPLPVPVHPTLAAWERFWAALDSVQAWEWHGRYDADPGRSAGRPGWLLRIEHGTRRLDASGFAAFPDGPLGRPGPAFRRVCRELAALAGDRPLG